MLDETKVELLHYPYLSLAEVEVVDGITLCSIADNGAMKLSAMANRGSKKDFFDIAAMLKIAPLEVWLTRFQKKYPQTDIFIVIKSLTWFEDAEMEPDPVLLHQQSWQSVKRALSNAVAQLKN